jgi:hypothetical protein
MTKSQITFKALCDKVQNLEYDDYIPDMTDAEAEGVALRALQWFIDNRLDYDLLDYFLSDVRGHNN